MHYESPIVFHNYYSQPLDWELNGPLSCDISSEMWVQQMKGILVFALYVQINTFYIDLEDVVHAVYKKKY